MPRFIAVLLLTFSLSLPVSAADVQAIGRSKDWRIYETTQSGEKMCFAATFASDKAPKSVEHGEVAFYVTGWRDRRAGQPSLKVGYDLRMDLPAKLIIGRQSWKLYTADNEAFAYDEDERAIVDALRKGSRVRFEGVSSRDTVVAYEFSLSGSATAIDRALSRCR